MPDPSEHESIHARLDDLFVKVEEARAESAGAHEQARITNGRVSAHDDHLTRHDGDLQKINLAMWGDDRSGLDADLGLMGIARSTRREVRLLGAGLAFALPIAFAIAAAIR